MQPSEKLSHLIDRYYKLTPMGLALCGQGLIEKINRIAEEHDATDAVSEIMEMRSHSWS
jgi:hypothetical protein